MPTFAGRVVAKYLPQVKPHPRRKPGAVIRLGNDGGAQDGQPYSYAFWLTPDEAEAAAAGLQAAARQAREAQAARSA